MTADPGRSSIGLATGTLVWAQDGPRPVETVPPGTELCGFDPNSYAREPAIVRGVQQRRAVFCQQVMAGGRLLTVAPGTSFPVFDLVGEWHPCSASGLQIGSWIVVDRRIPLPASPITLPTLDDELTALVGEDALAMTDALYSPRDYFSEMGKRGARLQLLELLGYVLGAGTVLGGDVVIGDDDAEVVGYYTTILRQTFRTSEDSSPQTLSRRLHRWMGEGLAPETIRGLPLWVWALESQGRAAFLRGFFDARGAVSAEAVTVEAASVRLLTGIQALLGMTAIEATLEIAEERLYRLHIRNVRRFAEWIHSNVTHKAALLRLVYAKEPRYPSDGTARLPMNRVRPALERIRAARLMTKQVITAEQVDETEVTMVETLRLLANAFHDEPLREMLRQQLFLEPVSVGQEVEGGTVVHLSLSGSSHVVANGIIVGSASVSE